MTIWIILKDYWKIMDLDIGLKVLLALAAMQPMLAHVLCVDISRTIHNWDIQLKISWITILSLIRPIQFLIAQIKKNNWN